MQTSELQSLTGVIHYKDWDNSYIPNILQEIYLRKIYFPYLSGKRDLVMMDIGFNIGLWSLYASKYAKTIYSFEPSLESYNIGLKNLEDNGIKNVKLYQKAISKDDGKTIFYHSTNTTMNSLNPAVGNTGEKEEVEMVRLDTFAEQEKIKHIDFIKLDIEGFEDKVLMGEGFQKVAPIIDTIVYEWHTWSEANPHLINTALKDFGFKRIKQLGSDATVFACTKL